MDEVKKLCTNGSIVLTDHLLTRLRQRGIKLKDIRHSLKNGEIIKQYPTDTPFPSCLINGENLHLVCSVGEGNLYVITAYRPSSDKWEDEGRKRKED